MCSSLETPKISVEGEEKKDCEEGSTAHPLDTIQVSIIRINSKNLIFFQENPALIHLFTDAALLDRFHFC